MNNKIAYYSILLFFFLHIPVLNALEISNKYKQKVIYFPAGTHRISKIVSSADNIHIKGDGSGVTVLIVPGGIYLSGQEPRLSGFTLVGSGNRKTGITLKNNYRALIQDVEIRGYKLGLLSLCESGHRQWLHTYRDLYIYEKIHGSKQGHNKEIIGVKLIYNGKKTKKGYWLPGKGFSNTHSFYGGRIAVPGVPIFIDGPSATKLFGTYIDIDSAPIIITRRSPGIQMFGVHLDRNYWAKRNGVPIILLGEPKINRLKIYGQHVGLNKGRLIRRIDGKRVNFRYIYLSPFKY